MKPQFFYDEIVIPSMAFLSELTGHKIGASEMADVMLMSIAGQESEWRARIQGGGGPARSYWQFERNGGVVGVLQHPASRATIATVCSALDISVQADVVYTAMAWNDTLACCMARLLLLTDPAPLPDVGREAEAWDYYIRNWRPGAPHRATWALRYQTAMDIVGRGWS